jgi:flagellar biosynthesis protein FliP
MEAADRAAVPLRGFMLKQTREADIAMFAGVAKVTNIATPDDIPLRILIPGLRHQRVENRLPDRLHPVHPVSGHRHGCCQRADVDGHDDDVAGDGGAALQADAVRLVDGWHLVIGSLMQSFNT